MDETNLPAGGAAAAGRATLLIALAACGFGAIAILVTLATRTGAPLMTLGYIGAVTLLVASGRGRPLTT